jgi:hypothetical protein
MEYAKNRWINSIDYSVNLNASQITIFNKVISEIDNNRPIMLINTYETSNHHAMVGFWYRNVVVGSSIRIVRINLWWWPSHDENWYVTSNIDYNINSIIYDWQDKWSLTWFLAVIL